MKKPVFPTSDEIRRVVQLLHKRPEMVAIVVTGGFPGLQRLLWDTEGSSGTLIDAAMPYKREATNKILMDAGIEPLIKFCNRDAADRLAQAAFRRATDLCRTDERPPPVLGLGATAALRTDQHEPNPYRYFISVCDVRGIVLRAAVTSGLEEMDRATQGRHGDLTALNCLLATLRLPVLPMTALGSTDVVDDLLDPWVVRWMDGQRTPAKELDASKYILYPGSFNPLHRGHLGCAAAASKASGREVIYEIETRHPVKPQVTLWDLGRRLQQFEWKAPIMVTTEAGLFIDKARRFPGFGFILGADTIERIADPQYYPAPGGLAEIVAEFHRLSTRFYVADRDEKDRGLKTLDGILMPPELRALCTHVEGRWDVSSTEIREQLASLQAND